LLLLLQKFAQLAIALVAVRSAAEKLAAPIAVPALHSDNV
jgi:hypothetical protein